MFSKITTLKSKESISCGWSHKGKSRNNIPALVNVPNGSIIAGYNSKSRIFHTLRHTISYVRYILGLSSLCPKFVYYIYVAM